MTRAGVRPVPPAAAVEIEERLRRRVVELVDLASPSGDEGTIRDRIDTELEAAGWTVHDRADSCVVAAPPRTSGRQLVVLAGHLDTVPPEGAAGASVEEGGAIVAGRGSADMKGGVAVAMELAADVAAGRIAPEADVGLAFFGREELPFAQSALRPLLARCAVLRDADLAIVMEPTANALELGCLGNLNVDVTFAGESAHSARPWLGRNAVHAAIRRLAAIASLGPADVDVDGLRYREVVSVTGFEGGVARNVVPNVARARVNARYAPGRTPEDAEAWIRRLLEPEPVDDGPAQDVVVDVVSNAPPAPPVRRNPLAARLRTAGDLEVRAKQAWTPVAEFAQAGVDAVNFGPGDPALAHRADEHVDMSALVRAHAVLAEFVADTRSARAEVAP